MAPGTYTGTVTIRGCSAQDCSSGDVAGSPAVINVSYTIQGTPVPIGANPNVLNFSFVTGAAAPAPQTVALTGDPVAWTASANQPWIGITPGSGVVGGSVSVSVDPTGLAPNTYNGTITFTAGGNTAPVSVSLTVAAPAIQTSQNSLSYSGINGATIASQSLNIGMNNGAPLNWTAVTPPADTWLVLNRTSGTQADPLVVSVNPANGPLASGSRNSTITLQDSGSPLNKTINVTLALTKATLTASPVSVTLGGSNGRDFSGVPVQLSLNTGANSFAWTSTPSASFIQRSPVSGSVSATPQTTTLTPNSTGLTGGTHTGSVSFSTQINGDTVSTNLPVTFNLESHKLLVDGNGVALASTPGLSKLASTVRVRDNLGLATNWTASSNQPWLTVTAGRTADGDLVLTANPAGLISDTVNLATVTITSPDTTVENTKTILVGLWVGSTTPTP
ncbi:MAG TPA: hypothetical protein VK643_01180, partial [Burkholderiales bacterium]|nr:hypothetical protein [Burkholderiales bacterium]